MIKTIAVALLTLTTNAFVSGQTSPTELQPGKSIERFIAVGEIQSYTIRMQQNQVLNLVAEQRGADVVLKVFAPDGSKAGEFDSPTGNQGTEPLLFMSQASGVYRIDVSRLSEPGNSEGRYEIKLVEVRAATKAELERVRIEQDIAEIERKWNDANERRDANALRSLMADDYANFVAFAAFSANKNQFIQSGELSLEKRKNQIMKSDITESLTRIMEDLAIVTGRVNLTMTENGKVLRFPIRFLHVWTKRGSTWQIVGDMTYPAEPSVRQRTSVKLDSRVLESFVGRYIDDSSPDYPLIISRSGENLILEATNNRDTFYPESDTVFFSKSTPDEVLLVFLRNAKGEVTNVELLQQGHMTMTKKVN
jgi:ketosteroid isomerase-like protein